MHDRQLLDHYLSHNKDAKTQTIKTPFVRIKVMYSKDNTEDTLSYNKIIDYIKRKSNNKEGPLWQYRRILGRQHTRPGDILTKMAANTMSRWNGKRVKSLINLSAF